MSVDLGTESLNVNKTRRSWRLNIECPLGQDYVLSAHRELVQKSGSTVLSQDKNAGIVSRGLAAVATEHVTLGDDTILTPVQIAEALVRFIEEWEIEDNS